MYIYIWINTHTCKKHEGKNRKKSQPVLIMIISLCKEYGWFVFYSLGFSIFSKFTKKTRITLIKGLKPPKKEVIYIKI